MNSSSRNKDTLARAVQILTKENRQNVATSGMLGGRNYSDSAGNRNNYSNRNNNNSNNSNNRNNRSNNRNSNNRNSNNRNSNNRNSSNSNNSNNSNSNNSNSNNYRADVRRNQGPWRGVVFGLPPSGIFSTRK